MWHEARKHEKKLRGMMVDYRRRAERRKEFFESIRRDPASYLQIHGQQMKVHIDPTISQAADASLVPWMGDTSNKIDRFDVRAHLDYIPTASDVSAVAGPENDYQLTDEQECQLNYERFRNLIQNEFLNVPEAKYLQQIYLEERCGQNLALKQKTQQELKKKLAEKKAAIGFNYDEIESGGAKSIQDTQNEEADSESDANEEEEFEDMDTSVHVELLNDEMRQRINSTAAKFGVKDKLFVKFLNIDKEDAEKLKLAKELENEKLMFVGRKSRRERKELKQQRLLILRSINVDDSVDHFGRQNVKNQSSGESSDEEEEDDRASDVDESKVEFITCFGNSSEDEDQKASVANVEVAAKAKKTDKKGKQEKKDKAGKRNRAKSKGAKGEETNGSGAMIFGPMLPSVKESRPSGNIKFANSSSNLKHRQYRYAGKLSDDEDDIVTAPVRERTPIQEIYRRGRSSRSSSTEHHRRRHRSHSRRRRSGSSSSPDGRITKRRRYRSTSSSSSSSAISSSRSRSHSKSRGRSRGRYPDSRRRRSRSRSHSRERPSRHRRKSRSRSLSKPRRYRSPTRSRSRSRSQGRDRRRDNRRKRGKSRSRSRDRKSSRRRHRSRSSSRPRGDKSTAKSCKKSSSPVAKTPQPKPDASSVATATVPSNNSHSKKDANDHSDLKLPAAPVTATPPAPAPTQPPIKRYYRHDLAERNSLSPELSEDDADSAEPIKREPVSASNAHSSPKSHSSHSKAALVDSSVGKPTPTAPSRQSSSSSNVVPTTSSTLITPQERLRRLMQAQLDKEYKRDKKAEAEKLEKQKMEQLERDVEMSKITHKINEKRNQNHRDRSRSSSSSSSAWSDDTAWRRPSGGKRSRRSRSRSRSGHRRSRSPAPARRGVHHRRRSYRSRSRSVSS